MADIHLLTGEPDLLSPAPLPAAALAALLGPAARAVPADWLDPGVADHGHDFLLDGTPDRRRAAMARALVVDYGPEALPVLVLPSLLDDRREEAAAMLVELGREIGSLLPEPGGRARFVVRGLTLPGRADPLPEMEGLAVRLREAGAEAEAAATIRPDPAGPEAGRLRYNLFVTALAEEAGRVVAGIGLRPPPPRELARLCEERLGAWRSLGLLPTEDPGHLRPLAEAVVGAALGLRSLREDS